MKGRKRTSYAACSTTGLGGGGELYRWLLEVEERAAGQSQAESRAGQCADGLGSKKIKIKGKWNRARLQDLLGRKELGCAEEMKKVFANSFQHIWTWTQSLNSNPIYFQFQQSLNILQKHKFEAFNSK
jgi:hypothetical protein